MLPHSWGRSALLVLLVAWGVASATPPRVSVSDSSTAVVDGGSYSNYATLSSDAIVILASMNDAFFSLRVQLAESKAALVEHIRLSAEDHAFRAINVYTELSKIACELAGMRAEETVNKADLDAQLMDLSMDQAMDSGNVYVELVDMRDRWDLTSRMLEMNNGDSDTDFYERAPLPSHII